MDRQSTQYLNMTDFFKDWVGNTTCKVKKQKQVLQYSNNEYSKI